MNALFPRPYLIVDNTAPAVTMHSLLQLAWDQPAYAQHVATQIKERFDELRKANGQV